MTVDQEVDRVQGSINTVDQKEPCLGPSILLLLTDLWFNCFWTLKGKMAISLLAQASKLQEQGWSYQVGLSRVQVIERTKACGETEGARPDKKNGIQLSSKLVLARACLQPSSSAAGSPAPFPGGSHIRHPAGCPCRLMSGSHAGQRLGEGS